MKFNGLMLLAGALSLLTACGEQGVTGAGKELLSLASSDPGYGFDATRNDWPILKDDQLKSDQLLAENYLIIFDGSGSMAGSECSGNDTKAKVAISAVNSFVDQISSLANVGLLVFDRNGIDTRIKLGTENRTQLKQKVSTINFGGGTPLRSALSLGLVELEEQANKQLGYGEYNIVIVTDGVASESESPESIVNSIYENTPVAIRTIGFCLGENHSLNQPGITYYKSADNPESLREGLASVLAESDSFSDTATFE